MDFWHFGIMRRVCNTVFYCLPTYLKSVFCKLVDFRILFVKQCSWTTKASSPYHYAKTAVYWWWEKFHLLFTQFFMPTKEKEGLPFFASNYLMELLPNWLCWGCKALAFYHHTRGRGGYVRFFQHSSSGIKSHFINHSTFLHTRFSKMYGHITLMCLNFYPHIS